MAFNKVGGKKPFGARASSGGGSRDGGGYRDGGAGRSSGRSGGRNSMRKKQNKFFTVFSPEQEAIDYKDPDKLLRFTTEKGKIVPRRITGLTSKQQKMIARAIKRARHSGFLAFQAD